MVCIPGRLATLWVNSALGVTPMIQLGGIVDITMNLNVDELECTSHDSNGAREYIPNHHDVTLDISARWMEDDAAQSNLLTSVFDKTSFDFVFRMQTDDVFGTPPIYSEFAGTAFATTFSPAGPLDDTGSLDITLRCSSVVRRDQTTAVPLPE
jgi:predicted secreted protein